ncbi:MAG: hypothetical protein JW863_04365 [Chitinispirillaceae bacterium]|nr:hypothetical protein [Chitinispirillaceae bacterium]
MPPLILYRRKATLLIAAFLFCTLPIDPDNDPKNVSIDAALCRDTLCRSDSISAYISDTVFFSLTLKLPHLIDSLRVTTLSDSIDTPSVLCAITDPPGDTAFPISVPHPCILHIAVNAILDDRDHRSDTVHLFIEEKPGSNTPPVLSLTTKRTYATPLLPCTVSVSATDDQPWQTLFTTLEKEFEGVRFVEDTLLILTPPVSDTGSIDTLIFITSDNSSSSKADTDTVIIAIIPDETPPGTPQEFRILQRKLKNVTFCWNRVASADYYRIYRNSIPSTEGWQLIDSTADTSYTDETDSVYFYSIVSVNVFYWSKPSAFIVGKDTLFHGLSFAEAASAVSETDSIHRIEVRLFQDLPETLTVPYSIVIDSSSADSLDCFYIDTSRALKFAPGDTSAFILLGIIDDSLPESGEKVLLTLGTPSLDLPFRDSIHRCTILPDRDSLRLRLRLLLVRFVCEMADDEGTDNDIEMDRLNVFVTATEQTADTLLRRNIIENEYLIMYSSGGDGIIMASGTNWAPTDADTAVVSFDADRFDQSKASITFGCYGREYDPTSANEEGSGSLTLARDHFFDNSGNHSFTMSSADFRIRVEVRIEQVD